MKKEGCVEAGCVVSHIGRGRVARRTIGPLGRGLCWFIALQTLAIQLGAQAPPGQTRGMANGHLWRILSSEAKMSFLVGFDAGFHKGFTVDGQITARRLETGKKLLKAYFPVTLSFSDIVKGVDEIYEDTANLILPIVDTMEIFALKASGAAQTQVDAKLAELRERSIKDADEEKGRP